ncbi:SEC12-like protein 1 [Acorus calamus]|uniref:SEC12-like protein 1 n=1 Tax=Acorus calamus TaxID=4465 RepID=A0AAV9CET1_ACOCL|nr:SEC12-like protein 1 [Acorus calamus]
MDGSDSLSQATRASWIRRSEGQPHLVVLGRRGRLEIVPFDAKSASLSSSPLVEHEIDGVPIGFAVHPSGDSFVCSTTNGCKLFELYGRELDVKLSEKPIASLENVGRQECLAFSTDGSRFATGAKDGHLRIFEWPSLRILLDEPTAHKSFRDMDFSLDSEFLASTSTDGSARIWKTNDGVPLTTLTRNSDETFECCRFSKDGTKPFLFCTAKKGGRMLVTVWDISTWKKIGYKSLLRKPISVLSISLDGKYLALGSYDGDICVVEVKKMEISHWSKKLHLGASISSIEFCPTERVILSTSTQHGTVVTKLSVPADWKEWQIYLLLLGLFLASAIIFYVFFNNSEHFWNFPVAREHSLRPEIEGVLSDPQFDEQNVW